MNLLTFKGGLPIPDRFTRTCRSNLTQLGYAFAVLACSLTCERRGSLAPPSPAELPRITSPVVGPPAAALQDNGELRLNTPTPLTPDRSEIGEARARELAQAFIATHGRGFQSSLEADHGGSIDLAALHLCGRVWYANAAFAPLPAVVPDPWQRHYGPWWLLTFCGAGERPQVSLAVSAYATEMTIKSGRLVYPHVFAEEFEVLGIPATLAAGLPPSPERAVERAATVTGVRVAGVPELIAAPPGEFPQSARWRLRLERPVDITARDENQTRHLITGVTEIFVSTTHFATPDLVEIADPQQPASFAITYRLPPRLGSTRVEVQAIRMQVETIFPRPDFPITYQAVEEQ